MRERAKIICMCVGVCMIKSEICETEYVVMMSGMPITWTANNQTVTALLKTDADL